jgi:hypothetical protein
MVEIESVFETGRRNRLRASVCSGHAVMMWCAVCRGSPHWQWCGSKELGRKWSVYSPVNAWPVRSLMQVATMGLGNLVIPLMKGGMLLSGGFVSARYAGWRRGASIHLFCHSVIASCRDVIRSWAFVGGGGGPVAALGFDEPFPLQWL